MPLASPSAPEERLYGKIVDEGGRAEGRMRRRRDGDYVALELPTGIVVRYQHLDRGKLADDHLFDADGYPLVTVFYGAGGAGPEKAAVHTVPAVEVPLTGWIAREVPGGKLLLPEAPTERQGGGARAGVLGGEVEVWLEAGTDPFSDTFRDGLVAGCGCMVVDRATTWIDGKPGVRYRLLVPGQWPRDAVDLWAVALSDTSTWLMSFRVSGPEDPVSALMSGRVLSAVVTLTGAGP